MQFALKHREILRFLGTFKTEIICDFGLLSTFTYQVHLNECVITSYVELWISTLYHNFELFETYTSTLIITGTFISMDSDKYGFWISPPPSPRPAISPNENSEGGGIDKLRWGEKKNQIGKR